MSIFSDAGDFVSDLADDAVDLVEDGVDAVVGAAEDIVDVFSDAVDAAVDFLEDAWDALVAAGEAVIDLVGDAIDAAVDAIGSVVNAVGDGLDAVAQWLANAATDVFDAVAQFAEWVDHAVGDIVDWVLNDVAPFVYGLVKLIVLAPILLAALPALIAAALVCTFITNEYGREYGSVLNGIAEGFDRYRSIYRITRLPAAARYVIFSDLHRYTAGDLDIPKQQGDTALYAGVLEYYGRRKWTLIENGDVEDYWLRGGSAWGDAYDLASGFTGVGQDLALESGMGGIAAEHLRRIVQNNALIYSLVKSLFLDQGRYQRTAGNHDDVYRSPAMVDELARYLPGVVMSDYICIDDGAETIGIVAHGHQTDAWNGPACSFLGRTTTSIVSAVNEVLPDSWELGVPGQDDTDDLWDGDGTDNELTSLGALGVDSHTNSLDEQVLHEGYTNQWSAGGPRLILGHTHALRLEAWDDDTHVRWHQYVNEGCGISSHMVTALEWDGRANPAAPKLTLVAWRVGSATEVERGIVDLADGGTLRVKSRELHPVTVWS